MDDIENLIPQRGPFLFIDKIIEKGENYIHAQKKMTGKEDFFKGHFPGNPIMPGVLMCEACFQAGAALLSNGDKLGVVTRIKDAKFRGMVRPGDMMDINVELEERLGNAVYCKGKISVAGKTVVQIKFQVAEV